MIKKIVFILYHVGAATGLFDQDEQEKLKVLMLVGGGFTGNEFREPDLANSSFGDQVLWNINKKPGGKHIPDPACKSTPNLITIKSFGHLAKGMRLLENKL